MNVVFQYFLNAFNNSVNLPYFFCLMFLCELLKMISVFKQNVITRKYFIQIKNKFIYFDFKWLVLVVGILLGCIFYYFEAQGMNFNMSGWVLLKLVLTFSITLTLYDFFFQLVIVKFKQVLNTLIKSTIKPMNVDLSNSSFNVPVEPQNEEPIENQ